MMKVQRSVFLLIVLSSSALGEERADAAPPASSEGQRRLKKMKKTTLRGGVDADAKRPPASPGVRRPPSDDAAGTFVANEIPEGHRDVSSEYNVHDEAPPPTKRALGKKKKKKTDKKKNRNAETQTHVDPEMEMEMTAGNKMSLGAGGDNDAPADNDGSVMIWGEENSGDMTGGGIIHHQPDAAHEASPGTGNRLGQGVFHTENGSPAEVENKLGLYAPPDGTEGVPIPIDESIGGDGGGSPPLPMDMSGGGELVDSRAGDSETSSPGDAIVGGGVVLTGDGTGGGVVVHHTPAEDEEEAEDEGPTNRGDPDDPCSSIPDSLKGTIPPANTGKNILVEAPASTWAQCDVMCEGYPDACAHLGYFYTLNRWGGRDRVRACMNLKGLSFGARNGCQNGRGNPLQ